MVTIATFNEQSKAKHLRNRLQQAGIGAEIIGDSHLQRVAFMAKPQAHVKVRVEEDDFGKAHQLMREWEASDPDVGGALRCPQCDSSNIEYPQMTRKFLTFYLP
jgi:4-hydroxy-3-methylbut-2-en-1-yl diphosphate synthase IspG/GcpE